jgi:hypothetical protein
VSKKRVPKISDQNEVKGFEEFIEGGPHDSHFLPRGLGGSARKNEAGFEHFTFLSNDSSRLEKLKELLNEKLPFSAKFDQSQKIIKEQQEELTLLKKKIFEQLDKENSPYRKSLREIFNGYFGPPKP